MGVPGLYTWLLRRWDGLSSEVKPHTFGCENLYVDMNGIIHPCCHSDNSTLDEETSDLEKFDRIGQELVNLVKLAKPTNVLYLAVDGVAPRAKMNHQRSRRHIGVLEEEERQNYIQVLREDREKRGYPVPELQVSTPWDSNVITPGTKFMYDLDQYLRKFIALQISNNRQWKNLTVVLSDSRVPGEGEHKLMDYIRFQRAESKNNKLQVDDERNEENNENKKFKHCFVSDDADLVFLGLATKEERVCILRDDLRRMKQVLKMQDHPYRRLMFHKNEQPKYAAFSTDMLRASLKDFLLEEVDQDRKASFDIDRAINDIILMSSLGGNDFLPHLPMIDIRGGIFDNFLMAYQEIQNSPDESGWKYLTESNGEIIRENLIAYLSNLAENEYLLALNKPFNARVPRSLKQCPDHKEGSCKRGSRCHYRHGDHVPSQLVKTNIRSTISNFALGKYKDNEDSITPAEFQESFNATIKKGQLIFRGVALNFNRGIILEFANRNGLHCQIQKNDKGTLVVKNWRKGIKKKSGVRAQEVLLEEFSEELDRYVPQEDLEILESYEEENSLAPDADEEQWEKFKQAYYEKKFDGEIDEVRIRVAEDYLKGLQWVVQYYINGVPSWNWFYAHLFAPFASDILNVVESKSPEEIKLLSSWEETKPVSPVEQLMFVLPEYSKGALPQACQNFFSDPDSPVNDKSVQANDIKRDPNGRQFKWQWVALLPFLTSKDTKDLSRAVQQSKPSWEESELLRDEEGTAELMCSREMTLGSHLSKNAGKSVQISPDSYQSGLYGVCSSVNRLKSFPSVVSSPYSYTPKRGLHIRSKNMLRFQFASRAFSTYALKMIR